MGTTLNQRIEEETISTVLNWNERDRAKLTYRLLLSLEDMSLEETGLLREDLDRLWEGEAQRRLTDFDNGKIGAVQRDEAMRIAREGLAK
jgi:hypothetical protein